MNAEWTNMAGFGPAAWNHGGGPLYVPSTLLRPGSPLDQYFKKANGIFLMTETHGFPRIEKVTDAAGTNGNA
jgi:hypothetical protein